MVVRGVMMRSRSRDAGHAGATHRLRRFCRRHRNEKLGAGDCLAAKTATGDWQRERRNFRLGREGQTAYRSLPYAHYENAPLILGQQFKYQFKNHR
jgi:hypothetical protein